MFCKAGAIKNKAKNMLELKTLPQYRITELFGETAHSTEEFDKEKIEHAIKIIGAIIRQYHYEVDGKIIDENVMDVSDAIKGTNYVLYYYMDLNSLLAKSKAAPFSLKTKEEEDLYLTIWICYLLQKNYPEDLRAYIEMGHETPQFNLDGNHSKYNVSALLKDWRNPKRCFASWYGTQLYNLYSI
jgi:hypothetical protein